MTRVQERLEASAKQAASLTEIASLLTEGRDIPAHALPEKIRALAGLQDLRLQIAAVSQQIWPDQPPTAAEDRDWSALRQAAQSLLVLLSRLASPLPGAVVRALTAREVRDQLSATVDQCDKAIAGGFAESWEYLAKLFDVNQSLSTGLIIDATPLSQLGPWLAERAKDTPRLAEWIKFCELEREIRRAEVVPILQEVLDGHVQLEEAGDAYRARFLSLWLDETYQSIPVLRQFATENHERTIESFRDLDRRAVASTAARICASQLGRADRPRSLSGDTPASSELGTLKREVNKKRRHLSLRKLFAAIPNLLTRLKPCLMMSPLAVSTFLDTPDIHFDLVIFDEASQVRPHDAICAIYRGRQLIVAGDQKQLPPTSFFQRALDDDLDSAEDEDAPSGDLEDFESILDVCCTLGLPRYRLRWHYRSRREGLIAFANHFIYGNELVTFPSVYDVAGNPAVAFEYVAEGRWKPGKSGGFNAIEAKHTAELVLAHFRQHPEKSLGVIAFSKRQQERILDELEQLRRANPDLETFFDDKGDRHEPFFVKNLETVQGDERDAIVLAIGYGLDETGRQTLDMRTLNQLTKAGGERRLNVAVTRARERMAVISSMRAQDIDLSRTSARGVKLLRDFLDYAERGYQALSAATSASVGTKFDSPFEEEVYEELTRKGLTVHTQVGCSGFRIDLAIVAANAPGRYLLGVECDGATYHSSATARDRDRLRQEVLERLGWRICRIWSTDWLRDREGQLRRVQAALEKAATIPSTPAPAQPAPPMSKPIKPHDQPEPRPDPPPTLPFASIDDVPELLLRQYCCRALQQFGATEMGELGCVDNRGPCR
jgi:very-short-patch-repair endonuclease